MLFKNLYHFNLFNILHLENLKKLALLKMEEL